jgi:hypothetical protein
MDDKRYDALPFLLALASLVTLASSFVLFILTFFESGFPLGKFGISVRDMSTIAWCLLFMGWIPGLALAIVSLVMLRHLRSWLEKVAPLVLSSLAIMAVLFWALFIYIVLPHR